MIRLPSYAHIVKKNIYIYSFYREEFWFKEGCLVKYGKDAYRMVRNDSTEITDSLSYWCSAEPGHIIKHRFWLETNDIQEAIDIFIEAEEEKIFDLYESIKKKYDRIKYLKSL